MPEAVMIPSSLVIPVITGTSSISPRSNTATGSTAKKGVTEEEASFEGLKMAGVVIRPVEVGASLQDFLIRITYVTVLIEGTGNCQLFKKK